MVNVLIWLSFPAALIAGCVFAWLRGSAADRYASALIFLANLVGESVIALAYPKYPGGVLWMLDFLLAFGLLVLAVRYGSLWLGAAMMLQSIALCMQAFDFFGDELSTRLHYVLNDMLSYAMYACIAAGTAASWRAKLRRRRPPTSAALAV